MVCEKILSSLFRVKKEEMTEGRKVDRASKTKPFSVAQGLDSPLACYERDESHELIVSK